MGQLDARAEATLATFVGDVERVLGDALLSAVLYGSAAGPEWVAGRSDINVALVVQRVTPRLLDALAPLVPAWRRRGGALPLLVDPEFLAHARDAFPMELDDIARQHRRLARADLFADLTVEPAAVRRQCEHEARSKLLRLHAAYLGAAGTPAALEELMLGSLKSFLVVLRHLLRLAGGEPAVGYADVLHAGERLLGPLPVMRRLLDHRSGATTVARGTLRSEFAGYLAEVERITARLDALDA
ncbi:MAG: hypothetical protein U0807_13140 [Candidatus Binatia bacterium]